MSWMEIRKSSLEWSIKFTTKGLYAQSGLLVLNTAGIIWNGYWAFKDPRFIYGFGMGAFLSNFLWTASVCARWFSDIKIDKLELKFIRELEAKEHINDDRKDYKEAKERYERMALELARQRADELGIGAKKEPNCTGESDGQVCTQADVRNCH